MPLFRHTDEKIIQFVKAKKTIDEGKLIFKDFERNSGSTSTGKTVRVSLSSVEIGILNMELRIHAPLIKDPTKFHAALLVDWLESVVLTITHCQKELVDSKPESRMDGIKT